MARILTLAAFLLFTFVTPAISAAGPPADLVQLEREVSLKLAHARDIGFTEPAKRQRLSDAHQADLEGEKALKAGDYNKAENDFLKAKLLLRDLGI
jgi:hypothetical protein